MDYSFEFKNFLGEVFACKQYKKLPTALKVFGFIAVFPFIALSALLSISFSILVFIFNLLASGTDYLEGWLKKTKEGVQHLTEAVIYLVALPFIFASHVLLSFISAIFFITWFFMQCAFYIATLGGIRWRPYITKINETDPKIDDYMVTTNKTAAGVTIVLLSILMIAYQICRIYLLIDFDYTVSDISNIISAVCKIATIIAVPIVFRKALIPTTATSEEDCDENFEIPEI